MPFPFTGGMPLTLGIGVADLPADVSASKGAAAPTTATATVNFNSDGTITNHAGASLGSWYAPTTAGIGSSYDIKYHVTAGSTLSSGAAADNTYIQMSSTRAFSNSASSSTRSSTVTWSLSLTGAGSAIDTATGTILADSS